MKNTFGIESRFQRLIFFFIYPGALPQATIELRLWRNAKQMTPSWQNAVNFGFL